MHHKKPWSKQHLHRTNHEPNFKWKNPNLSDIADIKTEDNIVCKNVSERDVSSIWILPYTLKTYEDIDRLVRE